MRLVLVFWIAQLLTVGLAWLALDSADPWRIGAAVALAMGVGVLASMWVGATMRAERRTLEAKSGAQLSSKALEYQRELSRQKAQDAERLADLARSATRHRRGLLRAGFLTGGAVGVTGALLMAQFVVLGLVVALAAGGAFAGYRVLGRGRETAPVREVETPPALERARGTPRFRLPRIGALGRRQLSALAGGQRSGLRS